MLRKTLVLAGCVVVAAAQADILFDNGPFVTHIGTGAGGADESVLQTTSQGMNTLGHGFAFSTNFWIAEDFEVPTGESWMIDALVTYGYQTGSATNQVMSGLYVVIYDASPAGTANVVFGDTTTNRLASSAWTGSYRVTEETGGNSQRPIMSATANMGVELGAGTYWIAMSVQGPNAGLGVFAPSVTINGMGQKPGSNAIQSGSSGAPETFTTPLIDTGNFLEQDVPFVLRGTVVPEPGSLLAIGAGLAFLGIRQRK